MKIVKIDRNGLSKVKAVTVTAKNGQKYFAVTHGENGRGRWEVRIPLGKRDFPAPDEANTSLALDSYDLKLVDLRRKDARGENLWLLGRGKNDGTFLVLWNLSPGFRGYASYSVSGNAEVITYGMEAQGAAGRMGGAFCPVVHVTGPCRLEWHRTGRLYNTPSDWIAEFDGDQWTVASKEECILDDAALNY